MYTGSLGEASKGREAELLAAADKYSLLELKKQCEKVSVLFLLPASGCGYNSNLPIPEILAVSQFE